jgi:hypothetical protein
MLVVDGNGLPLGFHLDGANRARSGLRCRRWTRSGWLDHRGVPSNGPRCW